MLDRKAHGRQMETMGSNPIPGSGAARPARKRSLNAALRDPNALRVLPLLDGGLLLRTIPEK